MSSEESAKQLAARLTRRDLLGSSAGLALAAGLPAAAGADSLPTVPPVELDPTEAVQSGVAWEQFCEALKPLGRHIVGPDSPDDLLLRTEGIRCLSRLVSLGLDRFLEHGDPTYPEFYDLQTPVRKYLGDNPDQSYRGAAIDGTGSYRIRGSRAGAAGLEIGVYAGTFRSDSAQAQGGRRLVGSLDESTLEARADGSFELTLSPDAAPGNHIRLEPDSNALLIRTYFWDRGLRRRHAMPSIERLDVSQPPAPLSPEALLRGLLGAVAFVDGSLEWWNRYQADNVKREPNRLSVLPDDGTLQTPSQVRYMHGLVAIEPEQALVVELTPRNEPAYWSLVLQNRWGETPDWRYRPVVRNNRELRRDEAGIVRVVIADRDPGVENWMDTAGHSQLLLSLRWRGKSALPATRTRLTSLDELT
jgi:hypothetical protein